ncbi:MarR family winged helix-turn-helix transcriptional regulator [Novosphingobium terrae]|uniref:MarR family winged helix-turn-helix transcriptional regulator n=1 Tax=Novosphingobium terrae TaxID=2726189 RepID=UPI001980DBEF|nr:MarR family winged helix-turn-helix transcriptional regulator [Novosphingobium terrae]
MYALNESLAFLLNRAGAAVATAFTLELKDCGLTLPMWRVLAALLGTGEQTLSGLAEVTSVEISTLSRQVGTLVDKKLVNRQQSGLHWRSVNISLTPEGRALVEELLPAVARHEQVALDGVNPADIRRLKLLLNKVYSNLANFDQVQLPSAAKQE